MDTVEHGEIVEAELDRLIGRHSRQKDPDEEHELWQESARAYKGRRREAGGRGTEGGERMANLGRRMRRLEEQAELEELGGRLETERVFREALTRLSTSELQAMNEYLGSADREGWAQEDEPLIRRLLGLMEEVRREMAEIRGQAVDPPWLSEIRREGGGGLT